jgi:flagellar hook-associated protein 2
MATVVGSSTGSIDVKSTVDQLIEVEMVKRIDPIDTKITAKQASLTAVAALKTLASSLQDSLSAFEDRNQYTSTDSAPLTDAQRLANLTTTIQSFVTNYNALQAGVAKYGTVDTGDSTRDTSAKVALFGDPALAQIRQVMRNGYNSGLTYSNALRGDRATTISFAELGVARKTDGTLTFSKTQLAKAVAADTTTLPEPVGAPTLSDSAYKQPKLLDRFSTVIPTISTDTSFKTALSKVGSAITGTFDLRTSQYNSQLYTLRKKRVSETASIETERTRLLKTYSKLNSLLANMSSTSSFLTAQLASLSKNNN